jgi:hypothetical protein
VTELVFFLEEESAKALLAGLLPRLIPAGSPIEARFIVFEGKQDLDRQLERKLKGYLNRQASFIVIRDQDRDDCRRVKRSLVTRCSNAGRPDTVVRIACRELEAFYLGDLRAVELGLRLGGLAPKQNKAKFRDPDRLQSPSLELERLTNRRYQKVAGSRAIAPHLDLERPGSRSFRHLIQAIRHTAAGAIAGVG